MGSQKVRARVVSVSVRGGVPELAETGHEQAQPVGSDEAPGRPQQVLGHRDRLVGRHPGDPHLGEADRAARGERGRRVVHVADPVMVIRRVVKVRGGKVTTWPGGVRDAAPRRTGTGSFPSKVRVSLEIERSGSPVWGWIRVSELAVVGLVQHHLPPLARGVGEGVVHPGGLGVPVQGGVPAGPRAGR